MKAGGKRKRAAGDDAVRRPAPARAGGDGRPRGDAERRRRKKKKEGEERGDTEERSRRNEGEPGGPPAPAGREEEEEQKEEEKKKNKKKRKLDRAARSALLFGGVTARHPTATPALNRDRKFAAEPADHCETPFAAYRDIEPFLYFVARSLKKDKSSLAIYDPYYCEGSVVDHLRALGFGNVYNRHEDFYRAVDEGRVPEHDVLVSNPPFSGDHMERAVRFAEHGNRGRPWLLLMPNFMCRKPTYRAALSGGPEGGGEEPFFVVPPRRYTFWSPGREFKADAARIRERVAAGVHTAHGKRTAPFECMWFCQLRELGPYAYAYCDLMIIHCRHAMVLTATG